MLAFRALGARGLLPGECIAVPCKSWSIPLLVGLALGATATASRAGPWPARGWRTKPPIRAMRALRGWWLGTAGGSRVDAIVSGRIPARQTSDLLRARRR